VVVSEASIIKQVVAVTQIL